MYTDAYDITIGAALAQKVHCTPMVSTAVRGTTNDEIRRYVRCTNFMNALFLCSNRPLFNRRHAAGKLLVTL